MGSASAVGGRPEAPVRLRDGLAICLLVFVAVRVGVSLVGVATVGETRADPAWVWSGYDSATHPGWHNAFDGTVRWDATWFLRIAQDGYRGDDQSAAFFPAYPIAVRAVAAVSPFGTVGAALIVSNASFFAALLVLHGLTQRHFDRVVAGRATVLLASFPAAFFFVAPYSESLYLLATLLAFWWADDQRWVGAGAAAALAALTRLLGLALVPSFALFARASRSRGALVATLAPVIAVGVYLATWEVRSGDALRPLRVQELWRRSFAWPVETLGRAVAEAINGVIEPERWLLTVDLLLGGAVVVGLFLGRRSMPVPYLVYGVVALLLPLFTPGAGRPLLSFPRYAVVVFPALWWPASRLRGPLFAVVVALLAAVQLWLAAVFMEWGHFY